MKSQVGSTPASFPRQKKMSLFDFNHQFVKYGEFHANRINQAIHIVFVPTILWTAQVWVSVRFGFVDSSKAY